MPHPNAITIRRATRADLPAIVRMLADDPLGQRRECYADPLPAAYYTAFDAIDSDARQELIVAEASGAVIGTLQLTLLPYLAYQGGTRALIESVRVDGRFRGQGIGQQLMHWAIARARAAGCHMAQLTTNASRADAPRFYTRLGFVASHVGMKLDLTETQSSLD